MIRIVDLVAIFLVIIAFMSMVAFRKKNSFVTSTLCIVAFIIISFRTIGDDTSQYVSIYDAINPDFSSFSLANVNNLVIEPLWFFFISLLKAAGINSPYLFFFLAGILPTLGVYWVYRKTRLFQSADDPLFFSLYLLILYQFIINGVRAFAACCAVLVALWFFNKSKNIKGFFVGIFAVLLHTSSLIIIMFLLISKLNATRQNIIMFVIIIIGFACGLAYVDWNDPYFARIYLKLDYYLFAVENDIANLNSGRELYIFFSRLLFGTTIAYSAFILLLSFESYKKDDFIASLYRCSLVTVLLCSVMFASGIYLFSYRIIMFIQPFLVLIFMHSITKRPLPYKLPFFIVGTSFFWLSFILYASRFYDS